MTTPRSTYYNYTYRSDGVKMREQSVHQYTKLVMKVSASGDTTYVQRNASDTHFRARYGNYVKETGQPDKIYNEEGYIALHGDSVSYHFFERDYLGSVRAVFDLYGNLEQTNDYNITGIPSSRHLGNADVHKHTGKEFQGFNGLAWYDNNARYYDPILARFTTQDPLAEIAPWNTPYIHCSNNSINRIDPLGLFDTEAEAEEYSKKYGNAPVLQDKNTGDWFISLNAERNGPYISGNIVTRFFGPEDNIQSNDLENLNIGINAFSIANGSKQNIIESVTKEIGQNTTNGNVSSTDVSKTLGKSVGNYYKGVKFLGVTGAAVSSTISVYNTSEYYLNGGTDWRIGAKTALDLSMTALSFCGPIGFTISSMYFIIDISTGGILNNTK